MEHLKTWVSVQKLEYQQYIKRATLELHVSKHKIHAKNVRVIKVT